MTFRQISTLNEHQIEQLWRLYQREWWTSDRTLADVRRIVAGSDELVAFVEAATDELAAFARILTDYASKALLLDVIVAEPHRGHGLGARLMDAVMSHPQLREVRHVELYSLPELMPFYQRWGFSPEVDSVILQRADRSPPR